MTALNNRISEAGSEPVLPAAGIDAALDHVLAEAAPVYRERWWPAQNQANLAWIAAVEPLIANYGDAMKRDVGAAWQTTWPAAPIRTDVAAFAEPHGAYTTAEPAPHITVSSTDPGYRGDTALEMLFHESSHVIDEKVRAALQQELLARHLLFRRRGFDHAILFYTAGEIARRYLPNYTPYGMIHGMYEAGWPGSLPILEKDWKPYLDGKVSLEDAIRAVVSDYGVPK